MQPFPALVFDSTRTGSLQQVIAPPYDLVDTTRQNQLYDRSPFNVIRLELNRDADPYASAAATLAQWRADGAVTQAAPAFYLYTQRFTHAGRSFVRNGLVARVLLEEFSRGRILPHEKTFPKAKEDRLRLLAATHTNISSIFGLYPSGDAELAQLLAEVGLRNATITATDDLGIVNELRAITSVEEIALVQRALEATRILIADGHHRYETALEYRRQRRAQEASPSALQPYDFVMMTLVAFDDPGLVILPTHRLVRDLPQKAIATFDQRCREHFELEECGSADALRAAIALPDRSAIGVALRGDPKLRLLKLRDRAKLAVLMPDLPDAVRELDVAVLHSLILDQIFGIKPDAVRTGGNIEYTIDANAALASVQAGVSAGAFLVDAPTVEDIERVTSAGTTMPEKSTYFFPKLITGLVMNPLE